VGFSENVVDQSACLHYIKFCFKIIFKQSHLVAPSLFLLTFVKGRAARIRVKMEVFVLHITIHFTVIVLTRLLMELAANKVLKGLFKNILK